MPGRLTDLATGVRVRAAVARAITPPRAPLRAFKARRHSRASRATLAVRAFLYTTGQAAEEGGGLVHPPPLAREETVLLEGVGRWAAARQAVPMVPARLLAQRQCLSAPPPCPHPLPSLSLHSGFGWESCRSGKWWKELQSKIPDLKVRVRGAAALPHPPAQGACLCMPARRWARAGKPRPGQSACGC